jgi:DNA replication protein DnaC
MSEFERLGSIMHAAMGKKPLQKHPFIEVEGGLDEAVPSSRLPIGSFLGEEEEEEGLVFDETPVPPSMVPASPRIIHVPRTPPLVELPPLPQPTIPRPQSAPIPCPVCKGAGFTRADVPLGHPAFGKPQPCQCKLKAQAQDLFGGAHLPDDFLTCSFESYLRLSLSPEQHQAAIMVQTFVLTRLQGYQGRKRGLYLHGVWGVGKTGLAVAALRQALLAGQSGLYLSTVELFDCLYEAIAASQRLMRGYGDEEDKAEETAGSKLLRLVGSVKWLVLDDLGVECGSRFVIQHLYRIIEERRSKSGLYTIFTSNKDARGLAMHWRPETPKAPAFDDCIRIIERIGEYCTPIHLVGRSLREK